MINGCKNSHSRSASNDSNPVASITRIDAKKRALVCRGDSTLMATFFRGVIIQGLYQPGENSPFGHLYDTACAGFIGTQPYVHLTSIIPMTSRREYFTRWAILLRR